MCHDHKRNSAQVEGAGWYAAMLCCKCCKWHDQRLAWLVCSQLWMQQPSARSQQACNIAKMQANWGNCTARRVQQQCIHQSHSI